MKAPILEIARPDLQLEVDSYKPGNGMAWPALFPLKYTPRLDFKGIEGEDGLPISADKVAFNAKAPLKSRKKVGTFEGKLAKIAISRDMDELEINEYKDLQTLAAARPEDAQTALHLVNLIYDDVKFCSDGLDAKVEIDALQIGSTGKKEFNSVTDGDNVTADVIDFNVPEENFVGVTKPAGATDADTIGEVIKQVKRIKKLGRKAPLFAFCDPTAIERILSEPKAASRINIATAKALTEANLTATDILTLDTINAYMRKMSLPQFLVIDSYVKAEHRDGEEEVLKPWNENVITLSPEPRLGYTYYKPVPEVANTEALQVQGKYAKTTVYSEHNPMLQVTLAEAYVQPILSNRKSLVFIDIKNTSYNAGK